MHQIYLPVRGFDKFSAVCFFLSGKFVRKTRMIQSRYKDCNQSYKMNIVISICVRRLHSIGWSAEFCRIHGCL